MRYHEFTEDIYDDYHLGGGWITDRGEYFEVDHRNGLHHSDIALDEFGDEVEPNPETGEHDEYSTEIAVDIAVDQGWIRVSTRRDEFSAEIPSGFTKQGRIRLLSLLDENAGLKSFQINDRDFSNYMDAKRYVRQL